jgi:hypothetical protein
MRGCAHGIAHVVQAIEERDQIVGCPFSKLAPR